MIQSLAMGTSICHGCGHKIFLKNAFWVLHFFILPFAIGKMLMESQTFFLFLFFFFFFFFLGPHLGHMEVPRLGVQSGLHLLAFNTAKAMPDPSRMCNLHHSSWQHQIPNPLNKARDRIRILMDTRQIHFC